MNEMVAYEAAPAIGADQARVNITYGGSNGDLPDPVSFQAADGDVKTWVSEALRTGGVPGIPAVEADLRDFVVDRFPATAEIPLNRLFLRPKTPFGLTTMFLLP